MAVAVEFLERVGQAGPCALARRQCVPVGLAVRSARPWAWRAWPQFPQIAEPAAQRRLGAKPPDCGQARRAPAHGQTCCVARPLITPLGHRIPFLADLGATANRGHVLERPQVPKPGLRRKTALAAISATNPRWPPSRPLALKPSPWQNFRPAGSGANSTNPCAHRTRPGCRIDQKSPAASPAPSPRKPRVCRPPAGCRGPGSCPW